MKNISRGIFIKPFLQLFILAGILVFTFPRLANAQPQNIQFKHLTIDNGLSQSWIHSICEDKYGFIWIATEDGLNRYDGYDFKVYKHNPKNKYSVSGNRVFTLLEDSKGNLLIGTNLGLTQYDRQNDRFIRNPKWPQNNIRSIVEDEYHNLWIGTNRNLFYFDSNHDSSIVYEPYNFSKDKGYLTGEIINAVYIDSKKNVWIGSSRGLNLYDKEKNSFINYYHENNNPSSLGNDDIRTIIEDKTGRLWIGTASGLDLFTNAKDQPRKGIFVHYKNNGDNQNSISDGAVLSLLEDNKHNLWIGIENGGLDLLDLNNYKNSINRFIHFRNDPNNETSISNNSIHSLFQDKQGNIWIGTNGEGLNIINSIGNKFTHIKNEPGNKNSLSNNQVDAFLEDNDFIWIGTEGGLNRYDKKDGTFKHYVHNPLDPTTIGANAVWALYKDKRGNLWVGTWAGGLNLFNYKTETFTHYYYNPKDSNSISSNNIFSILEDMKGNLWIGTMSGGLNLFNRDKKIFRHYMQSNSGISSDFVLTIIETDDGDLWFENFNALERFNIINKSFKHYIYDPNDSTSINTNRVYTLFKDSKGNLWVGTDMGLNLFDRLTDKFRCYQIEDGLPSNSIKSILEDGHGNLWLGTNNGLSKFINAIHCPKKPQFKNYTPGDGLQGHEFIERSCLKRADGTMYFGGPNGFNVFEPDKSIENTYIPPVVITDFQIFNKPVNIGERGLGADVKDDLFLSYTQSVFSFDFAALSYIASQKNQYAYKMEGFDKNWNYVGTKHTATYTNLDPGKYIFRVKGSNNDGVWNEKGIALPIVITPTFWQTLWFRLILVAVFLGIIFWIYKWQMQARDLAAQRQMEAALTKERNLLRIVIDNIPDGIYTKDLECRKTLTNRADVYNMGRKSEAEVLGKDDYELFPRELAEGFVADDRSVIQSGQAVINREEYVIDGKGQKHFLLTTKLPFRDEQNQIIGLIGIGRDVTEQRQAQEALQQERKLLRTLIDNLPDLVYVKDTEGRKTISNLADIRTLRQHSEADVLGKTDFDFYSKKVAEAFYNDDRLVIQTGQPVLNREEYFFDENGRKRWLHTSKLPLRDETGRIIGLVGVGHDITSRKEFEEALHESEERFRVIAEQTGQLVYDFQLETGSIHWSGAVQEVTGYTHEELQNLTISDWQKNIHPEDYNSVLSLLAEARKASKQYLIEYRLRCKDGTFIHVEDQGVFLKNELKTPQRMLGAIANITERKTASIERERLITELQNAIADIKVLSGLVPICSNCKKIRDDKGYWTQLEGYIQAHTEAKFSHGVCPECMKKLYPNFVPKKKE
ncbi:MAG: two-component regulator propeller domain-containing protein [Bacteroidota bacterium]|jgi:PAS domain S-box-containing protein